MNASMTRAERPMVHPPCAPSPASTLAGWLLPRGGMIHIPPSAADSFALLRPHALQQHLQRMPQRLMGQPLDLAAA